MTRTKIVSAIAVITIALHSKRNYYFATSCQRPKAYSSRRFLSRRLSTFRWFIHVGRNALHTRMRFNPHIRTWRNHHASVIAAFSTACGTAVTGSSLTTFLWAYRDINDLYCCQFLYAVTLLILNNCEIQISRGFSSCLSAVNAHVFSSAMHI